MDALTWTCADPATFAGDTLVRRIPQILDDTVARARAAGMLDEAAVTRCDALKVELTGLLCGLTEDALDRTRWDAACAPHVGKPWRDAPWYFVEAYFYRRILQATGFFQPGVGQGRDPFLPVKEEEERTLLKRWQDALDRLPQHHNATPGFCNPRAGQVLLASLWGNRADLSYDVGRAHGERGTLDDLLADERDRAVRALHGAKRVALFLDNAGTELAMDLLLADELRSVGKHVALFSKPHPFFVSDATPDDVTRTEALLQLRPFAIFAPWHLTSAGWLRTDALPAPLANLVSTYDVAVFKGDANYRRLVMDAPWQTGRSQLPFADAVRFPIPVIALRTLKAEVLVGVDAARCAAAQAVDPRWLVTGRFGVIQTAPG